MKCLYIGKFQPFHKGHLKVANLAKELFGNLTIALGSPNDTRYFTLDERIRMIETNTGTSPLIVEDLKEGHSQYNKWGEYVLGITGDIDIIVTGNERVMRDFIDCSKNALFLARRYEEVSGTMVRELIVKKDESWRKLVPLESARVIENSTFYRSNNII
jgi:nicotinamide-nucleotide adenylyltransferase